MTRKAHLEPHLSTEELKKYYRSTIDHVESRRWHLLWLVAQGKTIKEAAEVVGYNYDYALEVVKNYNDKGAKAVKNRHKGRKASKKKNALLDENQLGELNPLLLNKEVK